MLFLTCKKYHLKILVVSFNDTTSIIRYTEYQLVNSVYFLSSLDPYFTA
jgi:hypothetical protein